MICLKKIPHQHLIYYFLFLVFCFCLPAFGSISNSFATSIDCTWNIVKDTNTNSVSTSLSTLCSDFPSTPVYIRVKSYSFNYTVAPTNDRGFVSFEQSTTGALITFTGSNPSSNDPYNRLIYSNVNFQQQVISPTLYIYFSGYNSQFNARYTGTVVFEYSDNLSDFGAGVEPCPEIPDCPSIPENPYDNKLDDIKRAIIIVGAVPLVIYFFVCVYKIIVKDGGSRR